MFQNALRERQAAGRAEQVRIARWSIAHDPWLAEQELARIERLKELGEVQS